MYRSESLVHFQHFSHNTTVNSSRIVHYFRMQIHWIINLCVLLFTFLSFLHNLPIICGPLPLGANTLHLQIALESLGCIFPLFANFKQNQSHSFSQWLTYIL